MTHNGKLPIIPNLLSVTISTVQGKVNLFNPLIFNKLDKVVSLVWNLPMITPPPCNTIHFPTTSLHCPKF